MYLLLPVSCACAGVTFQGLGECLERRPQELSTGQAEGKQAVLRRLNDVKMTKLYCPTIEGYRPSFFQEI